MIRLRFLLLLLLCSSFSGLFGQISLSNNTLNFFTQFTGGKDSLALTINNNSPEILVISDVGLYHGEAYSVSETSFSVPVGGSKTIQVYCHPVQNVRYADWVLFKSPSHPEQPAAFVFAFCKHADTYYDLTFDKYHEDLKDALGIITSFGYTDLGYNPARDQLFMNIDNQAVNGQGATQNTIECVYTGTVAAGYTTRPDVQNNYNFNTEHTFPQSLFSELQPMRSDLHHLFPVTSSSNGERSNNPFGVVNNPSWTSGGSKSNGSTFEPRDAAKGNTARAMMYFVIRYQDYNNFFAGQEAILRQWNKQFPPTAVDSARNRNIEALQNVRNPFVDHPEFCDRIASFVTVNNGPTDPIAQLNVDSLCFPGTGVGDTSMGYFFIANQGPNDLSLSNWQFSSSDFSIGSVFSLDVPKDSARRVPVLYHPSALGNSGFETLTFATNDPNTASATVTLHGSGIVVAVDEAMERLLSVSPNPSAGRFKIRFSEEGLSPGGLSSGGLSAGELSSGKLKILDLKGSLLEEMNLDGANEINLDLTGYPSGAYFLQLELGDRAVTRKLIIQ